MPSSDASGDTSASGGWINGLHGLLALVVLLLACGLAWRGLRWLKAADPQA